jgi:hypothetical protein
MSDALFAYARHTFAMASCLLRNMCYCVLEAHDFAHV